MKFSFNQQQARGYTAIEVLIAMALFALTMVTLAMVLFPFLAGYNSKAVLPHVQRVGMESLCRRLDQDAATYRTIFGYTGEVRFVGASGGRISPTKLTYMNGANPSTAKDPIDFLSTPAGTGRTLEISPVIWYGQQAADVNHQAPDPDHQAHTLLFIGPSGSIDVVYHIHIKNLYLNGSAIPNGLQYETVRADWNGPTHQIVFQVSGKDVHGADYSLNNLDQSAPSIQQDTSGLITVIFPNPFSSSILNSVASSVSYIYKNPMVLKYTIQTNGH